MVKRILLALALLVSIGSIASATPDDPFPSCPPNCGN